VVGFFYLFLNVYTFSQALKSVPLFCMKKGTNKKENAIGKILRQFADDWLPSDVYWPSYGKSYVYYPGRKEEEARRRWREQQNEERQRLLYLKRKKWLLTKRTEKGLFVKLSDEGKMEKLRRTLEKRPKLKGGMVCLVMFDVPETARNSREAFRYFLKSVGFRLLQQSVWSSDRDVSEEVQRFVQDARIQKWVQVFVGKIEKERTLFRTR